jgi:hypothetical protein
MEPTSRRTARGDAAVSACVAPSCTGDVVPAEQLDKRGGDQGRCDQCGLRYQRSEPGPWTEILGPVDVRHQGQLAPTVERCHRVELNADGSVMLDRVGTTQLGLRSRDVLSIVAAE